MEEKQKKKEILQMFLKNGGTQDSWLEIGFRPCNASFLYCMQNGLFHDCEGYRRFI